MPETAKRTARVPILGEDGRISDEYIPSAIGESTAKAEAAATRAETAATGAEGSATAASQSAAGAQGSASAASASASQAQGSAATASGAATQAQSAQQAAEAAKTGAESARDSAQTSASQAQQSATAAASSAASVADKFISSAQATTLEPGSQATASVADQVLTIGVPRGEKGDKGDTGDRGVQGDKGDPGAAATIAVGSVTGLAAGASPTVVNSGTANAAVLDFGIPKGDKGDKGDPGTTPTVVAAEGSDLSVSTDGGTVTIDDSALRARIEDLENASRNVVTGTSTDIVAHGEDAYAQKPIEVRIKGKTWVNRWPVISGEQKGITVTTDETGLITVTGETSGASVYRRAAALGLAANKQITLAISSPIGGSTGIKQVYLQFVGSGGTQVVGGWVGISSATTTTTTTVPAGTVTVRCGFETVQTGAVNWSGRVMLVDGTEAPDCFTPCASIASAKPENLVTSGKNLINTNGASVLDDNFGVRLPNVTLQPGSYVVKRPSGLTGNFSIYREGDTSSSVSSITDAGTPFTLTSPIHGLDFRSDEANQITLDNISQFQLELGSTATAYEPPAVTATALPEVELRSLPNGTCDELVIRADGTCEVERRTYSYTATGEENVRYSGGNAWFSVSGITQSGFSTANVVCDKLATMDNCANASGCNIGIDGDVNFNVLGTTTDVETAKAWLATNKPTFVFFKKDMESEPQSPVTLHTLPAPTFNQYHDADVPSDTSTTYVRDINLVLANLESVQAALLGGE